MTSSRPLITPSNASRLKQVGRLGPELKASTAVSGQRLAFSPQGSVVLALALGGTPLRWWDVGAPPGGPRGTHEPRSAVEAAVLPDAEHIVTVGPASLSPAGLWRPRLVSLSTKDGTLTREHHLSNAVTRFSMSGGGEWLLLMPLDGESPLVWDVKAWRPLCEFTPLDMGVHVSSCALSPDGRFAAATFSADDGRSGNLWLWAVGEGAQPVVLSIDAPTLWSLAFHPTEPLLVVGGSTEEVAVVDLRERRLVKMLPGFVGYTCNLSFNPQGDLLIASWDGRGFGVHRFDTGEEVFHFSDGDDLNASDALFSPDGRLVAWGQGDGTVALWGVED
ncbi:WD repeat-containing protein [Myxococcus stipitatus DSM 14675]|uniref:WD repeat-containing protein n=1 Tax=Myxococcus stipitatus (strain DSM 14675 / JCM 12634 / Mx s8) TaxID=1278073 RepID=L7U1J8_MYXSD|nr:WD repeat-containing protein [Myxococcus stipitatus]AGC42666.1 WD repeat-containing protein [Myxococcus stipitatus DSM 14675]